MKTCLVLGAGATLANAIHFRPERMRETRPPLDTTFFETVDARRIPLSGPLRLYFRNFIGIDPTPTTLRGFRMEEVFKDVSYDFREAPGNTTALNAYIDLVELYLRVLRETTNWLCDDQRTGAPVGHLMAAAAKRSDELTVMTFNHDLVIENEIARRKSLASRWCLDESYGAISSSLSVLHPAAGVPVFHVHSQGLCDHARPITILKLHGSLNWAVQINSDRPTAQFLRTGGGTNPLQLVLRRQIGARQIFARSGGRGRSRWVLWPIVVPPVYAKQELRGPALQQVWSDARASIQGAERLVFFGYSLPDLDVEAEKLFESGPHAKRECSVGRCHKPGRCICRSLCRGFAHPTSSLVPLVRPFLGDRSIRVESDGTAFGMRCNGTEGVAPPASAAVSAFA